MTDNQSRDTETTQTNDESPDLSGLLAGLRNTGSETDGDTDWDEGSALESLQASSDGDEEETPSEPVVETPIDKSRRLSHEREARAAAKERDLAKAERDRLKAELDELRSNKLKALGGKEGLADFVKRAQAGEFPELVDEVDVDPETAEKRQPRSEIEQVKAELQRIKDEKAQAELEAADQHNMSVISRQLEEFADEFPVLNAVGERWARTEALKRGKALYAETGETPDLKEIFSDMNNDILQDAAPFFDNERALAALLADPKRRELASKILLGKSAPAGRASGTMKLAPKAPTKTITSRDKSEVNNRFSDGDYDVENHEAKLLAYARKQLAAMNGGDDF